MYEQDVIFGPFSAKQFITILFGLGLSNLLYRQIPAHVNLQIYIWTAIVFIMGTTLHVAFNIFKNKKIPLEKVEEYLKLKKTSMTPDEYKRMLQRKIVIAKANQHLRKEKGLSVDDSLTFIIDILGNLLQEIDLPNVDIS